MKINKKILILIAAFVLLGATVGGYFYFKNATKEKEVEELIEKQDERYPEGEEDQIKTDQTEENTSVPPTPAQELKNLEAVTLTVYVSSETINIGTKTVPAGSISLNFYTNPGTYVVQKEKSGVWQNFSSNIKYSGSGGLSGGYLEPAEDNVNVRVGLVEGNAVTAVSKSFTIIRSELSSGFKTYN